MKRNHLWNVWKRYNNQPINWYGIGKVRNRDVNQSFNPSNQPSIGAMDPLMMLIDSHHSLSLQNDLSSNHRLHQKEKDT
jgi:hypothetical protein